MAAPSSYRSIEYWEPFATSVALNLYETVRPSKYLNALLLNGNLSDALHTVNCIVKEFGKELGNAKDKFDLNFTLCNDDPYKLARDLVMIHVLLHETVVNGLPKETSWDIYFNPLIAKKSSQVLQYHIHILSRVTDSLKEWQSCGLSKTVHIGSAATLKELNRVFKRYEGLILDNDQVKKVDEKMKGVILGENKITDGWKKYFSDIDWAENEVQAKMERAVKLLHRNYWNLGRLGPPIEDRKDLFLNQLFLLSPTGDFKRADFGMNPLVAFKKCGDIHIKYMAKDGPSIIPGPQDESSYQREMDEILLACMDEFVEWGNSLRIAAVSYQRVKITVTLSDPMEYLHEVRRLEPPNSAVATAKIIEEIYSPNSEEGMFDSPSDLTYTTIEARYAVTRLGYWNLVLGAIPVLDSPGGLLIVDKTITQADDFMVPVSELFGVDEDTICTLFGFHAVPEDDPHHKYLVKTFGVSDLQLFQNGRYGFTDPGTWDFDLRVNHAKLEFEYQEIVYVITRICASLFHYGFPWHWKNTAATFSLMIYSLKSQHNGPFDWPSVARDVRIAFGGEVLRSDEFWVHQHIHGFAPDKVWQCHDEETKIEEERRIVCITLFIPNAKLQQLNDAIQAQRRDDRRKDIDPFFQVVLGHPWRYELKGCDGHLYRNIRVSHGTLIDPNGFKNYPQAENYFGVYTGAPVLKCVRDGWSLPSKGWTALSFLTGLGLREWGLKAVDYEVILKNGFAEDQPLLVVQTGVLFDDYEKDVMCFSRTFPVLIEDRKSKNSKKMRKKKKKRKSQGDPSSNVQSIENLGEDAKEEDTKDDMKKGEAKEEEGKGDAESDGQVEKPVGYVLIGGRPDEKSVFLQTKQGFNLRLYGRGADKNGPDANKDGFEANTDGFEANKDGDSDAESSRTLSAAGSDVGISVDSQDATNPQRHNMGLDGTDDREDTVDSTLSKNEAAVAGDRKKPPTDENRKPEGSKYWGSGGSMPKIPEAPGPSERGYRRYSSRYSSRASNWRSKETSWRGNISKIPEQPVGVPTAPATNPNPAAPDYPNEIPSSEISKRGDGVEQPRALSGGEPGLSEVEAGDLYLDILKLDILGDDLAKDPVLVEVLKLDILGDDEPFEEGLWGEDGKFLIHQERGEAISQQEGVDRTSPRKEAYQPTASITNSSIVEPLHETGLKKETALKSSEKPVGPAVVEPSNTDSTKTVDQPRHTCQVLPEGDSVLLEARSPTEVSVAHMLCEMALGEGLERSCSDPVTEPPVGTLEESEATKIQKNGEQAYPQDLAKGESKELQEDGRQLDPLGKVTGELLDLVPEASTTGLGRIMDLRASTSNRELPVSRKITVVPTRYTVERRLKKNLLTPPRFAPNFEDIEEEDIGKGKKAVYNAESEGQEGQELWRYFSKLSWGSRKSSAPLSLPLDLQKSAGPPGNNSLSSAGISDKNLQTGTTAGLDVQSTDGPRIQNEDVSREATPASDVSALSTTGSARRERKKQRALGYYRQTKAVKKAQAAASKQLPGSVSNPTQNTASEPVEAVASEIVHTTVTGPVQAPVSGPVRAQIPKPMAQSTALGRIQTNRPAGSPQGTPRGATTARGVLRKTPQDVLEMATKRKNISAEGSKGAPWKGTTGTRRPVKSSQRTPIPDKKSSSQPTPTTREDLQPAANDIPAQTEEGSSNRLVAGAGAPVQKTSGEAERSTSSISKSDTPLSRAISPPPDTPPQPSSSISESIATKAKRPAETSAGVAKTTLKRDTLAKPPQDVSQQTTAGKSNEVEATLGDDPDNEKGSQFRKGLSARQYKKLFGKRPQANVPDQISQDTAEGTTQQGAQEEASGVESRVESEVETQEESRDGMPGTDAERIPEGTSKDIPKAIPEKVPDAIPEETSQGTPPRAGRNLEKGARQARSGSAPPGVAQGGSGEFPTESPREPAREALGTTPPLDPQSALPTETWEMIQASQRQLLKQHRARGKKKTEREAGEEPQDETTVGILEAIAKLFPSEAPSEEAQLQYWERPSQSTRDEPWEVVKKGPRPAALKSPVDASKEESQEAVDEMLEELFQGNPNKAPGEDEAQGKDLTNDSDGSAQDSGPEDAKETIKVTGTKSNKKKKKKGKRKINTKSAGTAGRSDDESWYVGGQAESQEPQATTKPLEPPVPKDPGQIDKADDGGTTATKTRPMTVPVIPKTKLRFDGAFRRIISRTATIEIAQLMASGLTDNGDLATIDDMPVDEMIVSTGIRGLYYFKIPMMTEFALVSIPGAKGLPDSIKWMGISGIEIRFITPG
ncbi:hypothetical protein TWF718_003462 [Orbilia javanica]|uniref:Uncharacterized protein n=1 Tax=Orbilia javanica TaxID=47235 RepID=A0AAN8MM07_9PEZI